MRKGKVILGVDFGGTRIKIAMVDLEGRIRCRTGLDLRKTWSWKKLLEVLSETVEALLAASAIPKRAVLGLGMGLPGLVDFEKGSVHHLVNVRGWKNVPAASLLRKRLKLPVFIDNDVNLMALGEATYGAARGFSYVICLTLGTGVGGGMIFKGQLYRGATLSAGEVGHIPVSQNGPRCACGSRGCLETYVGNRAISDRARERIRAGEKSLVQHWVGRRLRQVTPEMLSQAARRGDRLSLSIWKEVGEWIGIGLTGLVNVYNPDRIVIGGGVAEAGEILFRQIRKTLKERAMTFPMKSLQVVKAKLGNDAGVIGASVLVRRSLE